MITLLRLGIVACALVGLYVLPLLYLSRKKLCAWWDYCLLFVIVFLPAVLLFSAIGLVADNVPFWDDYDAIIRYVCHPIVKRMRHLLDLHNQHRIVTVRLFLEGMVLLCGSIDFKICMLCGTAQLFVVFACFCFFYIKQFGTFPGMFLVIASAWLLFSLHNFENAFWALTAIQNFGVIMWAFLAIILFHYRSRRGFCAAAWGCAVTSMFTSVQGLAVPAIFTFMLFFPPHDGAGDDNSSGWPGVLQVVLNRLRMPRHRLAIFGCFLFVVLSSRLYMSGYVPGEVEVRSSSSQLLDKVLYVLAFLGNPVMLLPVAITVGCIVAAVFVFVVVKFPRLPKLMRPLFFFSMFLIACDVAGVNFRAESPYSGLCYRYYIIVACLYSSLMGLLLSLIRVRQKWLCRLGLVAVCMSSIMALSYCMLFWTQLNERSESLRINLLTWPAIKDGLRYDESRIEEASMALEQIERIGLYDHKSVLKKDEQLPVEKIPWAELHFP